MNIGNTLIALAYVKETENPMEVFCNYILICLLKAPEKKMRHDELCCGIEEMFGIKMPHHMIKMFCRILEKQKKICKLSQGAGYLCLDDKFDLHAFEEKKDQLYQKEWVLVNGLMNLAEDYNIQWTYEDAKRYLTDFLVVRENAVKIFSGNSIEEINREKYIPNEWYVGKWKIKFDACAKARNPVAHGHEEFLSDEERKTTEGYCIEILDCLSGYVSNDIEGVEKQLSTLISDPENSTDESGLLEPVDSLLNSIVKMKIMGVGGKNNNNLRGMIENKYGAIIPKNYLSGVDLYSMLEKEVEVEVVKINHGMYEVAYYANC